MTTIIYELALHVGTHSNFVSFCSDQQIPDTTLSFYIASADNCRLRDHSKSELKLSACRSTLFDRKGVVKKVIPSDQTKILADKSSVSTTVIAEESLGTPFLLEISKYLKEATFT